MFYHITQTNNINELIITQKKTSNDENEIKTELKR